MKLPSSAQNSAAAASNDYTVSGLKLSSTDGLLSLSTAEKMLKWHAEAVGRMVDLSAPSDVSVFRACYRGSANYIGADRKMHSHFSEC